MSEWILGTRGSQLALAQSRWVAARLQEATGTPVRLQVISTKGDRVQDRPLPEVGGKGLFTVELEDALREGRIHLAVHSLKDLPTDDAPGLCVAAYPERADPRDVLIGATLDGLAQGAVVGTGSARRQAQLLDARPDLVVRGIRGNVDTRLQKLQDQPYDAIVLAAAGLARLGLQVDAHPLDPELCVPAPGQGCLGIQCAVDSDASRAVALLDVAESRAAVAAERAFLNELEGGCSVPAGAYAVVDGDQLWLRAMLADDAGVQRAEVRCAVVDGPEAGRALARTLRG